MNATSRAVLVGGVGLGLGYLAWRWWTTNDRNELAQGAFAGDIDNVNVATDTFAGMNPPPSQLDARMWGSATAKARGLDNTPPPEVWANLFKLQTAARSVEALYPVRFTSFYRCAALNVIVGGVSNSRHQTGRAMDIHPQDGDLLALKFMLEGMTNDDGTAMFSVVLVEATWLHCEVLEA